MPKAVSVPPQLDKAWSGLVHVKNARVVRDQFTSIGNIPVGIGMTVMMKDGPDDEEYSALFSVKLDAEEIGGSLGRIVIAAGFSGLDNESDIQKLVNKLRGMTLKVVSRGGKHYWYAV